MAWVPSAMNMSRNDCGLVQQPLAQQPDLLLEDLDRLGLLECLDLRSRGLERAAGVEVAIQVVAACAGGRASVLIE